MFVGEGSLLVRCAEVFLDAGHQIRGVVSSNLPIQRWAEENMIPYVAPTDNVVGFMSRVAFDYLFSVVNPSVLPKEILALPRKLGVNFHDALLPKYAGTHATTWALINGEQTHGVTWHEMTEHVDAGRILKQRAVDLSEDETTSSLNVKWQASSPSRSSPQTSRREGSHRTIRGFTSGPTSRNIGGPTPPR